MTPLGPAATWSIHFLGILPIGSILPRASVSATRPSSPRFTSPLPSKVRAAERIAPAWTVTVSAATPFASRTVPSPRAKAAVSPRKAASTTNAPKGKGCSVGIVHPQVRRARALSHTPTVIPAQGKGAAGAVPTLGHALRALPTLRPARVEAVPEHGLVELAADEDEAALALFAVLPGT